MKKIIYSLVIMIAAGSLFTSCIEQVEPEGILALREAKARYYDALAQLRAKDGLYREAEAALKNAEAALKQAEAAHQQAVTDAFTKMEALNRELKELEIAEKTMEMELRAAQIAQEIDQIQKEMEIADKQHEIDLIEKQKELAQAQEALRVALRDIALAAQDLTANEKAAVIAAAEAYAAIWEKVNEQEIEVMKAEKALADAQRKLEMGKYNEDYAWDSETHSYQAKVDLYNREIERAKGFIEEDKEKLENVPTLPDVDEWSAELDAYQALADLWEYSRHELTQEAAAYYVQYVHDGVKAYNDEVDAWVEANKAVADPGKEPAEPQQKDYKINNVADSLAIEPIKVDQNDPGFIIYKRFGDLVGELDDLPVPNAAGIKNKAGKIATVTKEGDEYTVNVTATTALKNLIFGNKEGKKTTLKYKWLDGETEKEITGTTKYGVDGAISVLRRELVLAEEALDVEALEKAYKEADSTWRADRAVLEAGLAEYAPYKDAKAALDKAKEDAEKQGDAMVNAVHELIQGLVDINATNLSKVDSAYLMTKFANFAAAREDYFKYEWDPEGADPFDRHFYWYGNTIGDTLYFPFRNLSYDALAANRTDKKKFGTTVESPQVAFGTKNHAFAHIANQLLNETYGKEIKDNDAPWSFSLNNINDDNCKAFYTLYKYVPESAPGKKDDHFVLNDGKDTPFESPVIAEAKKKVNDAIDAYMKIYNAYWYNHDYKTNCGTLTDASTADDIKAAREKEIKVGIYTENTFIDPYTIANFVGDDIIFNDGLGTILAFIDPLVKKAEVKEYNNGSNMLIANTIFGDATTPSTFAKYLKAKQAFETHGALLAYKEAIEKIENWAKDMRKVFDDAIENNGKDDTAAYTKAHDAWKTKDDKWKTDNEKYTKYNNALIEFTGKDKDGKALGIKKITGSYPDVKSIQYKFELVNVLDGEWVKSLGGKQLELANKYFPEFPEKLNDWYVRNEEIDDEIAHYNILIDALKPAYYAACKAAGYVDALDNPADFDALVEAYEDARQAYIDALEADIEAQEAVIDANAKLIADFESGVPALEIEIAEAQAKLNLEQKKLTVLNELLKGAKENLDRIIAYLLSQDVNFINLANVDL